jgi:hypothetical protein
VALGGRLDRAGVAVAAEPLLDGAEADVEAARDLGLCGVAGEGGGDDAASEVERERSGRGRGGTVRLLKPSSYSKVALEGAQAETVRRREAVAATGLSYNTAAKYLAQIRGAGPQAGLRGGGPRA